MFPSNSTLKLTAGGSCILCWPLTPLSTPGVLPAWVLNLTKCMTENILSPRHLCWTHFFLPLHCEQLLSQLWGYFPTSIGYPVSYMIHRGTDLHIFSRRLHIQLETAYIFNSERDPMHRKNTFFSLETQQHFISSFVA